MPDAFITNSVEDSASGGIVPASMAWACALLWWRTYSLKDETNSSLEMDWAGVKSPVPLNAIPVTDGTLLDLRRETEPAAHNFQGLATSYMDSVFNFRRLVDS
jgi:hypothetical protein